MNGIIDQLAHGGAFILAAIGFLIFFLTQIWRAVHVEESYGENLISVKQPKKEWLLLAFILIVGIVVVVRLFMEYGNPGENQPESYRSVLLGGAVMVIGLLIFLAIRTVSPTRFFTNGILVHDYGYVPWEDVISVDRLPDGRFQIFVNRTKPFKGKSCFIRYEAPQEAALTEIFRKYVY